MLTTIFTFLLFLILAVILIEVIFWILGMIFPGPYITPRVRGLLYALVLVLLILWALNGFSGMHPFR